MNILIISRGYPTKLYPMNGIFELDQAKAIANLGHNVILASVDMRSIRRRRKWIFEKHQSDGVLIYGINLPIGRVPKSILYFFSSAALKILYKKIIKEQWKPDIMHAHFGKIGYPASKLKKMTKIPLVITEHSSEMMKQPIEKKLWKLAQKTYPKADRIITVSPALSEVIHTNFNITCSYIPNIVDTNLFTYKSINKHEDFTFITVGNLIHRKRMDLTIHAFKKTFSHTKVKLIIIGDGEERKNVEELVDKLKLKNQVILKGKLSRDEISKFMKESDCFVLPSRVETFGVVYIEAMASGLPVIATKCGGPEVFVNESNGLLVPIDDVDALANAMDYMYREISKYDKYKIHKDAYEQFSPKKVAQKIVEEYNKVLSLL